MPGQDPKIEIQKRVVYVPRQICEVRDGRFVEPCQHLTASSFELVQVLDMRSKTPLRNIVGGWTEGRFMPFKVCPFCAVELPKI